MTWSLKPSLSAGTYPNALQMERLVNQVDFLSNAPMAWLKRAAAFSVANSTVVTIDMDTATYDNYGGWSASSNPSRYTVQVAGTYMIAGGVSWESNATGLRTAQIRVNGVDVSGSQVRVAPISGTQTSTVTRTVLVSLSVNDYIEIATFQSSGGALNTGSSTEYYSSLMARWVAF